nr:MAG TPA: hypothetical protein [Caudoviricetes sp.]
MSKPTAPDSGLFLFSSQWRPGAVAGSPTDQSVRFLRTAV